MMISMTCLFYEFKIVWILCSPEVINSAVNMYSIVQGSVIQFKHPSTQTNLKVFGAANSVV
jgi:hypothetical protein